MQGCKIGHSAKYLWDLLTKTFNEYLAKTFNEIVREEMLVSKSSITPVSDIQKYLPLQNTVIAKK